MDTVTYNLMSAIARVQLAGGLLSRAFSRFPQSVAIEEWQQVKDGIRKMEDWLEKQVSLVDVPTLERALTALRYAAEQFAELEEFDDAAMMEQRADDLAAEIRTVKGGKDE